MKSAHRGLLIFSLCLVWMPALHAQTASQDDRLRAALRDTTRKLNEAQDELASLRAEAAALRQQVATPPKACPVAPEISPRARRQIDQLSADNAALRQYADEAQKMVAKWQEAQAQWQAGVQQATQQAQTNEAAARTLQEQLQRTQEQADTRERDCVAKNAKLVQISSELLQRYRDKGLWDLLRNAEPITQIKRVELETLLQEYGGKIQDNRADVPEKVVEHGN